MIIIHIFAGDNFSSVYLDMLNKLYRSGNEAWRESRNGDTIDIGPSCLEISEKDHFRIPLLLYRRFNPFFALAEFSWLITGSNRLDTLQYFIKDYGKYSDDQKTLSGAYGHRLRKKFNSDQVQLAVEELKKFSATRRIVLSMWSTEDLGKESKDIPCNIAVMFKVRNGKLDMTVINRSNDVFLGVPYNVVVFYLLQCYIAEAVGISVGVQRHFIDSLHLYTNHLPKVGKILEYNSKNSIEEIDFDAFALSSYLSADHSSVAALNFSTDTYWGRFLNVFSNYIEHQDKQSAMKNLPDDLLGYAGRLFFTSDSEVKN